MRRFGEGESKYLKGSDLQAADGRYVEPIVVIDTITTDLIGDEKEEKYILYFVGKEKGLCLNVTNERVLMDTFGEPADQSTAGVAAHFKGKAVQLYFDPAVSFGGRRVGGLRLRAAPNGTAQAEAPAPPPMVEPPTGGDDSIPF